MSLGRQFHCFADQKRPLKYLNHHQCAMTPMSFRISAHPLTTSPKGLRYGNGIGILRVGHQDPTFTQHRHRDVVHTRTCPHDLACPLSCGWTWLNHFYTIYNAWTSKTQQHVGTLIPTHLSSAFRLWWIIELVDASWKIWWSPSKFHANYGGTPFGFLVLKIYMQPRNSKISSIYFVDKLLH